MKVVAYLYRYIFNINIIQFECDLVQIHIRRAPKRLSRDPRVQRNTEFENRWSNPMSQS